MADISTGTQRGIVPFVDETTGRLPDQYLPQGVIDLQGDLEQAVTDAQRSATEAASSASNASQSASSASTSASQAGESASRASGFASTASQAATTATGAASSASASATAAQQSATAASASASAAKTSETNAASSASAAKQSETNAADSATAAREAVDGFGLEVGTTATGDPGSDAAVEIQKQGTKYTANFTIPRGDKGADGVNENVPLGSTSGVVAQGADAYPALPRKVQVHGRTVKNLWPVLSTVQSGVTFSTDETGLITVSGTEITGNAYVGASVEGLAAGKTYVGIVSATVANLQVRVQGVLPDAGSVSVIGSPFTTSGTTIQIPAGTTNIQCMLAVEGVQGQAVNASLRVMLVEGDTAPDCFVPTGLHSVQPGNLVTAGKNLINTNGASVVSSGPFGIELPNTVLQPGTYRITRPASVEGIISIYPSYDTSYVISGVDTPGTTFTVNSVENGISIRTAAPNVVTMDNVGLFQLELGSTATAYEPPNVTAIPLPEVELRGLPDGTCDELVIAHDGTATVERRTQLSGGEVTALPEPITEPQAPVTLPKLPAPTFNVYTTGGNVPPTVDVDYERDVNLVLQAMEAKIAALEVNQTIMEQGA